MKTIQFFYFKLSRNVFIEIEKSMDKEALRVLNSMPTWIPGRNRGEVIAVKYTLPIKFVLK